jgi:DnaJ-class molecular chaperone
VQSCPRCNGRGVTGRLVRGEGGQSILYLGAVLPVLGVVVDGPCGECAGAGRVTNQRRLEIGTVRYRLVHPPGAADGPPAPA